MNPGQADELERYCARWRHLKPPKDPPPVLLRRPSPPPVQTLRYRADRRLNALRSLIAMQAGVRDRQPPGRSPTASGARRAPNAHR